jgi:hypothetical protein
MDSQFYRKKIFIIARYAEGTVTLTYSDFISRVRELRMYFNISKDSLLITLKLETVTPHVRDSCIPSSPLDLDTVMGSMRFHIPLNVVVIV